MPLARAEFDSLDAYVQEVYTPSTTGPHALPCARWGRVSRTWPGS